MCETAKILQLATRILVASKTVTVSVGHIEDFVLTLSTLRLSKEWNSILLPMTLLMQRKQQSRLPVSVERRTGL